MNNHFDSRWRTALQAVALLGLMAACGGGDDAGTPPAPPPGPVTFILPLPFASNLTDDVTVQATSSDPATTRIEFQIDGTALVIDATAPYGTTVDSNAFASGQHVLRARAIDAAGQPSAWTPLTVQFGGARTQPAGFTRNEGFASGLSAATAFTQLPDGRLLVAQQGGALRVLQSNGTAIGTMLTLAVDSQGERGLLGVTPHPDFASNGFLYVYYTTTQGATHNRISRFTVSGNTAGSEVQIADLPALSGATNHNGGAIHFGVDGKLYVGVGENANRDLAQDLNSPLGKLLRFNDDGSIPGDNPFCTTQGNLSCAIWARGLRNPFTFAVRASDGRIHINDVGQNTWEEVNVGARGANYGWPSNEGP
ncbi:MAG TPA: PQQ-dependent sugar dehydrogenase, partial [Burkholderiaceae bacterium]|nr:PQQ-dependent sugar dehydrogenase [Burkholderiaceae bacterium]